MEHTRRGLGGLAAAAAGMSLAAGARNDAQAKAMAPRVVVTTELGAFEIEVYPDKAPLTANDFLAYVDQGFLNGSSVYRIVSMANQPDTVPAKIEVIQFGLKEAKLPPVPHESTMQSGLLHRDGTLSLARLAPGTGSSAFFICIGAQPSLDFAGKRNPDGQGFAAFGQVIEGMDVVRRIFSRAEPKDAMEHPIPISKVERV